MGSTGAGACAGTDPGSPQALQTREREENFPVALAVLPRRLRNDLHAVYAFARTVDEIGDAFTGDRTARLHGVDRDLEMLWHGGSASEPAVRGLAPVVVAHQLDAEPFHRLVQANLRDQSVSRYQSFEELIGYCRLSADPVGRIVLGVFDCHDPETVALSDRVCTALQLLEHWQDVGEDQRNGRIYLPQDDLAEYGVAETDLAAPTASPELRNLMRFEIERAAVRLEAGAPIVARLHGWARLCVGGFVAGGRATVTALRETGGDVLGKPARPSRLRTAGVLAGLLATAAAGRGGTR